MITQKIREEMKQAMIAKDQIRLNTMRGLLASFTNELVAKKRKPDEELSDDDALSVISRAVKQRKDSIEQFKKGGRDDLVADEEAELKILEQFLPAQMSREEILKVAQAKKDELGIADKTKLGQLIGVVAKELKGKADGALIKEIVESIL